MSGDNTLPAGFAALEPFVQQWAVAGTAARAQVRDAAGLAGCQALFAAAMPLAGAALDHLDGKGFAGFDAADERLMNLMLGLGHAAQTAEIHGASEPESLAARVHMIIRRSPADQAHG